MRGAEDVRARVAGAAGGSASPGESAGLTSAAADVSVVVPVYNVAPYLARCLDSLLAQTVRPREIICVDDASTDGSAEMLRAYERRCSGRIRVLRNERNGGLGAARDAGMRAASGAFLMFVDSDDEVPPDYVQTYMRAMEAQPCDILIGGYRLCGGRRQVVRLFPHADASLLLFSAAWGKLFCRAFLVRYGLRFSGIRYAEDTYLSLCALAAGARCGFIDYAGYRYWQSPRSLTRGCSGVPRERDLAAVYGAFLRRFPLRTLAPERAHLVEFAYVADMLNTLLIFGCGCGVPRMREALRFFRADLRERFPAWRRNPLIGLVRSRGIHARARVGVAAFALLDRAKLASLPFYAAAICGRRSR